MLLVLVRLRLRDFHSIIRNASNDLAYEHPGFQSVGLVQAGIGGKAVLWGPCGVDARSLGLVTTSGWSRWRIQGTFMISRGYTGLWAGVRQGGYAGHAQTSVAAAVARHESGSSLVVGMFLHIGRCAIGLESAHDFSDDGQDGYSTVSSLH